MNRFKTLSIAICYVVSALLSEAQCTDDINYRFFSGSPPPSPMRFSPPPFQNELYPDPRSPMYFQHEDNEDVVIDPTIYQLAVNQRDGGQNDLAEFNFGRAIRRINRDNQPNLQILMVEPQLQQEEQTTGIFGEIRKNGAFQFIRSMNEKIFLPSRYVVKPVLNFLVPGSGDVIDVFGSLPNLIGVVTNGVDAGAEFENGNYFNSLCHLGAACLFSNELKEGYANNISKNIENKSVTGIKRKRIDNEVLNSQSKRLKPDRLKIVA